MRSRNFDTPEYKKFRAAVRKRDGYKCQFPGCNATKKLQVHHINKWATNSALRFAPANGITLCKVCHTRISGREHIYAKVFQDIANKNANK